MQSSRKDNRFLTNTDTLVPPPSLFSKSRFRRFWTRSLFWVVFAVIVVTVIALAARIACCFWGFPLLMHPDEWTVVNNAIDMLSRASWEANVYNRPDQFEIKLDSLVFSAWSWLKYGMAAPDAFAAHRVGFFMCARFVTACFGAACTPAAALFVYRAVRQGIARNVSAIAAAVFIAFVPVLVEHSGYATPDIVQTFFAILFACLLQKYMIDKRPRYIVLAAVTLGISISIKYPAACLALPLAICVIWEAVAYKRKPTYVIKWALIAAVVCAAVVFVIAPNLFTNFEKVIEVVKTEARPNHLGADGLGFFGNMQYYAAQSVTCLGWLSILMFILGCAYCVKTPGFRLRCLPLITGIIYWVFISAFSLHWQRWGMPIYAFFLLFCAIGTGALIQLVMGKVKGRTKGTDAGIDAAVLPSASLLSALKSVPVKIVAWVVVALLAINAAVSCVAIVYYSLLPQTTNLAVAWCSKNGISLSSTLSDAYGFKGPAGTTGINGISIFKIAEDGSAYLEGNDDKLYFVASDNFRARYFAEPERYKSTVEVYNAVESTYELVADFVPDGNYTQNMSCVVNIWDTISYLATPHQSAGSEIWIYKLK